MSDDWLQECEPFMRTGETPAQCIARQRAETSKALLWFAEERKRVEKLEQENERLLDGKQSRWVWASERLPEDGGVYFVVRRNDKVVTQCLYDKEHETFMGPVTVWLEGYEMPEPPALNGEAGDESRR